MENEKRLIDANALLEELDKFANPVPNKSGHDFLCGIATAITEIEDAPTVDAVEVVLAYWVGEEPGDWHCSHCGEYAADGGYEQTRYCPNCGAKMDGDGNGT